MGVLIVNVPGCVVTAPLEGLVLVFSCVTQIIPSRLPKSTAVKPEMVAVLPLGGLVRLVELAPVKARAPLWKASVPDVPVMLTVWGAAAVVPIIRELID